MRNTLKILVMLSMGILFSTKSYSQDYNNAIGLRGAWQTGLTFKHFVNSTDAFELLLATAWRGFEFTGLYERHANAFDVNRLNWYYGAGAHIGVWDGDRHHPWFDDNSGSHTVIGLDGIIGMEYNLEDIPFNVSIDWKPEFNLSGYNGFWGGDVALSIRYIW